MQKTIDSRNAAIPWSYGSLAYSPDGSRLVVGGPRLERPVVNDNVDTKDVYTLVDIQTNATTLLERADLRLNSYTDWAAFSKDGEYIVTRAGTSTGGGNSAVFTLHDATTGNITAEFSIQINGSAPRIYLVAFVPVAPNIDITRAEKIVVSTEVGNRQTGEGYANSLYYYEINQRDVCEPPDSSDAAGALATTGLFATLAALALL